MKPLNPDKGQVCYALVTAARNEQEYIGRCIESVLGQTVRPVEWVIASDGSTDRTDAIVSDYARNNHFIRLIRKERCRQQQGFASKVFALNMAATCLNVDDYQFIGNLDADITFQSDYYRKVLDRFRENPKLGIAGGYIFEREGGAFKSRPANSTWSVAGGIQLFRRECYQAVGGLKPMPLGGEDWHAEIKARMDGWEVKAFPDIPAFHHKPSAGKRGLIKEAIREGAMDYSMGTHPLFEIVKCLRRVKQKPYGIFAAVRLYGFMRPCLMRQPWTAPKEVVEFLRSEQLFKLRKHMGN
jgi:poly-beta-1,6-N-acetyl-D-glucosamine synthase